MSSDYTIYAFDNTEKMQEVFSRVAAYFAPADLDAPDPDIFAVEWTPELGEDLDAFYVAALDSLVVAEISWSKQTLHGTPTPAQILKLAELLGDCERLVEVDDALIAQIPTAVDTVEAMPGLGDTPSTAEDIIGFFDKYKGKLVFAGSM